MKKTLEIRKTGINGEGIGYDNRKIVFVEGAIEGEIVELEIEKETPQYKIGKLHKIVRKSSYRVSPKCPYYTQCGGCSMMHIHYSKQADIKTRMVADALQHYYKKGKLKIEPIITNDAPFYYRNQAKLPVEMVDGKLVFGMFKKGSNYFVPIKECIVHEKEVNACLSGIEQLFSAFKIKAFDFKTKIGLRYVVVRHFKGNIQVTFITGKQSLPIEFYEKVLTLPLVKSVYHSENTQKTHELFGSYLNKIGGQTHIKAILNREQFIVSPKSFFQLNTKQTIKLYDFIKSNIKPGSHIIDAYCGVGSIGLYVREKLASIKGIEIIPSAVADAKDNGVLAKFEAVNYELGEADYLIPRIAKAKTIDCLLLDPPRTGLEQTLIEAINKSRIQDIIYVSCNPSTLAKNLELLAHQYEVTLVQPFDMFSQTQHVETVVCLKRKSKAKLKRSRL